MLIKCRCRLRRSRILAFFALNLVLSILSFLYYIYAYDLNNTFTNSVESSRMNTKYGIEIKANKLDTLFDILHNKEREFEPVLEDLGIFSFGRLAVSKRQQNDLSERYSTQLKQYFRVDNGRVRVNNEYVSYLTNKSEYFMTASERQNFQLQNITDEKYKPVIVTAANMDYYGILQYAVYQVHKHYPDYKLIIYDLGLGPRRLSLTKANCRCEVRKFDPDGKYKAVAKHVTDLKTYAWKPLIIQETLKQYDSVLYIDSSIRLQTAAIQPVVSVLSELGFLTQFINFNLVCYTNPLMFSWFGVDVAEYTNAYTADANILMFKRRLETELIMKAWVTCALDRDCIAPPGSRLGRCCGCHRYDQDAITIISSFFYVHNHTRPMYTPVSFSHTENRFFKCLRNTRMYYFNKTSDASASATPDSLSSLFFNSFLFWLFHGSTF